MTAEDYGLARRMWHQLEPVHALFWYAPEVFAEAVVLGYEVTTRWPSYFAWGLAPLGAVGPRLAASACYSFSPAMVTAHVPAAWAVASPPQILAARERAVDRMYRALPGLRCGRCRSTEHLRGGPAVLRVAVGLRRNSSQAGRLTDSFSAPAWRLRPGGR